MRAFFEGLGDLLEWSFGLVKFLGNGMNILFVLIITALCVYWLGQMIKHKKAGEA